MWKLISGSDRKEQIVELSIVISIIAMLLGAGSALASVYFMRKTCKMMREKNVKMPFAEWDKLFLEREKVAKAKNQE
jgi:hypothetical protein